MQIGEVIGRRIVVDAGNALDVDRRDVEIHLHLLLGETAENGGDSCTCHLRHVEHDALDQLQQRALTGIHLGRSFSSANLSQVSIASCRDENVLDHNNDSSDFSSDFRFTAKPNTLRRMVPVSSIDPDRNELSAHITGVRA